MDRSRRLALIGGFIAIDFAICCGVFAPIFAGMPANQGARLDGGDLVGVDTGGSYAWIVPTDSGVVLVDSGMDTAAETLIAEVAGRTIHAVLVTHGHGDHVRGLQALGPVPVYMGPGEGPLVRGEVQPGGWLPRILYTIIGGNKPVEGTLTEITDGQTLEIDGQTFQAITTPGHTSGSAMYVWHDVLFTGDSLTGHGDYVDVMPGAFADDIGQNEVSIGKLPAYAFDRMADGHSGLHTGVKALVEAYAP